MEDLLPDGDGRSWRGLKRSRLPHPKSLPRPNRTHMGVMGPPPLLPPRPAAGAGFSSPRLDPSSIDYDEILQGNDIDDDNLTSANTLFGHRFRDPIDVNDDTEDPSQGDAGMTTPSTTSSPCASPSPCNATATGGPFYRRPRKKQKLTSDVWDDFNEIFKELDGKQVRYAATCRFCKSQLTAPSNGGTGHLRRHCKACAAKSQNIGKTQCVLQFNADGSVRSWDYDSSTARTELCRLIATLDLPLGFGAHPAFERYIRIAHNPRFHAISRTTTTKDFVKVFDQRHILLLDCLKNSISCVALTSDIWSGNAKEDYISVVAHFVNEDWNLQKRIIAMRLINVSHTAVNIASRIKTVIDEFGLTDKTFSITLDNASANSKAMDILRPKLSGYVGPLLLHQRCACHIINLIVKSGLKHLKTYLEDFRTTMSFLNASNQRIASYKSYCVAMGVRPRKFGLDMDVR
jgi:hypothetical protein